MSFLGKIFGRVVFALLCLTISIEAGDCISFRQTTKYIGPFNLSQHIQNTDYIIDINVEGEFLSNQANPSFNCQLAVNLKSVKDDSFLKGEFKVTATLEPNSFNGLFWVAEKQNYYQNEGGFSDSITCELLKFDSKYYIYIPLFIFKDNKSKIYHFELLIPTDFTGDIQPSRLISQEEFDQIYKAAK